MLDIPGKDNPLGYLIFSKLLPTDLEESLGSFVGFDVALWNFPIAK